jgi:hypothetical protein
VPIWVITQTLDAVKMMSFNFIASERFELDDFRNMERFVHNYADFQTVTLNDENELELLMTLMDIKNIVGHELDNSQFTKYWDLSNCTLPELDKEQFDQFYDTWILRSQRENNMEEYGSLIFLQGLSSNWNKLAHRLIVSL